MNFRDKLISWENLAAWRTLSLIDHYVQYLSF
jgi:hypothetical protein